MNGMLFDNWASLARVLLVGSMAYVFLVLLLRLSGKRTLSKMNAFDLVITVALGSTFATVVLSKTVALAEGVLAFALLATMQFIVTWLSVRSASIRRLVKSDPRMLFYRGRFLYGDMRAERVTEAEVQAAVRSQGSYNLDEIEAVVLETDGTLSVLNSAGPAARSALSAVKRFHAERTP